MKNLDNNQIFADAAASAEAHSPFLSRLLLQHPQVLADLKQSNADEAYAGFTASLSKLADKELEREELIRELRVAKGKLALMVALLDISGTWQLEQVTAALSDFAQSCLNITIDNIIAGAAKRGEITHARSEGSGLITLGMGKLGGRELNYSSDIDLILFYEPGRLGYKGRHNEQHFMNKLAHELLLFMHERTADGYVFRTDLRLRPDPSSTPPVVNVNAGYNYYESVGQNWERAAMIKARPIAGDMEAGEKFLKSLTPFMWRRNLDFAAINDIHSIKRQMDSRQNKNISIKGHNIKLGLGGIREIEFFAQIHQLIWGGREPSLRLRGTCDTLAVLTEMGLISAQKNATLQTAYRFFRTLEHRIQMVADEQTHSLPGDDAKLNNIAGFMGYGSVENFSADLLEHLYAVHDIYASSFRSAEGLGNTGNLVFTGVSNDAETLKTLRDMGYTQPEAVSETIMGWHHGSCRATRTKRARELLTEMMPALLKRLSETANPDTAFLKFNEFLKNLPASIQLFSLFQMNPHLLGLISDIMGSAPTLASTLSHTPELLDAVLYEDFYGSLPSFAHLEAQLQEKLERVEYFEDYMDNLRQFRNEKQFQAGVQFLKHMIDASQAGNFLSALAQCMVKESLKAVLAEFEKTYGTIPESRFAIIALGKLGSREMTFSSDIDLVFVYDAPDFEAFSSGEKSFTAGVYYNRLVQRLLNAISGMGRDGRLYEVDTRLRPSGKQGPLAVSRQALDNYFSEQAWTFEYMAFTKARAIAGDESLIGEMESFIGRQISKSRDFAKLKHDVADMRSRIEKEHEATNPWNIKYVRGGLIDIDFIAQYLILRHAPGLTEVKSGGARDIFTLLKQSGCLGFEEAEELLAANRFLEQLFNMLRLCSGHRFDENTAPEGLKKLLVESVGEKDFEQLNNRLLQVEKTVYEYYKSIIHPPTQGE
jgi:glutamate-ammonia-ligase adenylyltransferase